MTGARALKYLAGYTIPLSAIISLSMHGFGVFITPIYAFGFLSLLELAIPPDHRNLSSLEAEMAKQDKVYDWLLYLHLPLQFAVLIYFLVQVGQPGLSTMEIAGMILSMGVCCGVIGINVGHELGHRVDRTEQRIAQLLLMTSLYMHFFIEHNKGHHKRVSTPEDPSSARYNEPIYLFFFRTIIFSIVSAIHIQGTELKQQGRRVFSVHNTLLMFFLVQAVFVFAIGVIAGWTIMVYFVLAAFVGILLLESVNYIEHYGLRRQLKPSGHYERVKPWHSWNSDFVVGRVVLYELTRHSDHHYLASKKYQTLDHTEASPQLPAGYPAMILLALVPPLFFSIMNPRIKALETKHTQD